jgi:hypothetical protein
MDKKIKSKKKKKNEEKKDLKKFEKKIETQKKNNLLKVIFLIFGLILIAFFAGYSIMESKKSFEYKGVKFNVIQEGELTFYNTQVPIYSKSGEKISAYNFYLRTDPRELAKIDFNGTITPMKLMALNYTEDLNCQGYGIIAMTNIINLYQLIGTKVTVDKNATCDTEGRYAFLNIQKTSENKLEEIGTNCYNLNIKNCDVFPITEKFMLETFVKIKQNNIRAISSSA